MGLDPSREGGHNQFCEGNATQPRLAESLDGSEPSSPSPTPAPARVMREIRPVEAWYGSNRQKQGNLVLLRTEDVKRERYVRRNGAYRLGKKKLTWEDKLLSMLNVVGSLKKIITKRRG